MGVKVWLINWDGKVERWELEGGRFRSGGRWKEIGNEGMIEGIDKDILKLKGDKIEIDGS